MSPMTVPMTTRIAGVMRLLSKEYFTRNTIPRKRTNPPIHAKSFTPKNASQSNGFDGTGGGGGIVGGGGGPGATGFGGGESGIGPGVSGRATPAARGIGGGSGGATVIFSAAGSGTGTEAGTRSPRDSN